MSRGLAGVVADASSICLIDGVAGRLCYRGRDIAELSRADFDEVACLLIDGRWPSTEALVQHRRTTAAGQCLPVAVEAAIAALPTHLHPMEALMAVIPLLGDCRPSELLTRPVAGPSGARVYRLVGLDEQRMQARLLLARLPLLVAYFERHRRGLPVRRADPDRSPLHNFLELFTDRSVNDEAIKLLGRTQILQMEHGFNASTFSARVVASTLSPLHACLSAAVAALYGRLHGGADEAAYTMARKIGHPGAVPAAVDTLLAAGGRVMGMGHRVYRTRDPRVAPLETSAQALCLRAGAEAQNILATLKAVEAHMQRRMQAEGRAIHANVEFYKGPVFHALGIPPDSFTAMFALARAHGWVAHILELWSDHCLYRPRARYVASG